MISEITYKFFLILQSAIGKLPCDTITLDDEEWHQVFELAVKQSLVGVILEGAQRFSERGNGPKPPLSILYEWIGQNEQIRQQNHKIDKQCEQLSSWFNKRGFPNCIIKGQGVARLYPKPEARQPGDVDIWVDGNRSEIVKLMRSNFIGVTYVDYVNCHASFFTDTEVEVHFRPTWFFNPFVNRKVQKWIRKNKAEQMAHYDEQVGFNYPTLEFNLVFSLIHIYRHVLFEGIGLRQLTDYYFILIHSNEEERQKTFRLLRKFGVGKFVGAVMYVMQCVYGLEESLMLSGVNEKLGKMLLDEILRGGNFGQYDDRLKYVDVQHRWKRGWENFKRDMRFIKDYPSEVAWMPIWKVWHYFWRLSKGYLD